MIRYRITHVFFIRAQADLAPSPACLAVTGQRPWTSHSQSGLHSSLGVGHLSRRQHQAGFHPTRGHALVVFNDMDKDKNGKITRSELEEAALALGFSLEQANRLFDK